MNIKKLLIAGVVAFVAMFILGYLWHAVLMSSFYEQNYRFTARPEPIVLRIAVAYFVLAFLMSYVYPLGYKGGSPMMEGLRFGIIMGILWVFPLSLILNAITENLFMTGVLVDTGWHIVEEGIAGIIIGLLYGKGSSST
jgi:hypothetical protein